MKKIILCFFLFLTPELFSQSWEFIPQDSILQFNEIYQNYGKLNISTIITKGDSTIFVRYDRDTILMIYDYNKKEMFHILKEDFWKCLKNDSLFNIYRKANIYNLTYDSKGNYWFSVRDTMYKNTPIFKVTPDTSYLINQIFVRELDSSIYITPFPNNTIRKFKEDKNGDMWLFLLSYIRFKDSLLNNEYEILCKYVNNRFETIIMKKIFWQYVSKCNFVFDNQNRVWYVVGDTCYIIKDEIVEKKISTWDAKDGYGYFSELAIDTKGNFFATNNSLILFKYDGDSLTTDRRILDLERYLTQVGNFAYRMRIDSLDNLWFIGYETCNLYKIDKEGNLTTYDVPKVDTSAEVEWCYKIYLEVDKRGKLWIAAQSMGKSYGIYIFNPDTTTSVEEHINSNTPGMPDVKVYKIYPNPADNMVTLEFFIYYDVVDQLEVGIYNIMGMKIKDATGQIDYDSSRMRANLKFSVADLPRGSYIVSVKAGKTSSYKLLLVGY